MKFYEKGDKPLEIVSTRQWYIRNGGRDELLRERLLAARCRAALAPRAHEGALRQLGLRAQRRLVDLTSAVLRRPPAPLVPPRRQRRAGLRRPDHPCGRRRCPSTRSPTPRPGFTEDQRGVAGGFIGDPDIMDTWATSSLTPQIAGGWSYDDDLFERVFPMDLRPQAHEIIRTWLFSTVVRAHAEHDSMPWSDVAISGWILDPDRKKMAKSKGNVVTPMELLEEYGSDARALLGGQRASGHRHRLRHRPDEGRTTPRHQGAQRQQVRPRRRRGRFPRLRRRPRSPSRSTERSWPGSPTSSSRPPARSTTTTTPGPRGHRDRSSGRSPTTTSSWSRSGPTASTADAGARSAHATLATALSVLHRLFAPVLPFVTEEVWSWWQDGSVHRARVADRRRRPRGRR